MEGNGGTADNRPENRQDRPLVDQHGRPLHPEQQEGQNILTNPNRPENTPFFSQAEKTELRNAWIQDYRQRYGEEPDINALNTIDRVVERHIRPEHISPSTSGQDVSVPPRTRRERDMSSGEVDDQALRRSRRAALEDYARQNPQIPQNVLQTYQDLIDLGLDPLERAQGGSGVQMREPENDAEREMMQRVKERERYGGKVNNMNEFLEEVMAYSDPSLWGVEGKYPLLEKDPTTGEQKIRQDNLILWLRDRMVFFHNEAPDEQLNMFAKVRLQREYRDISIGDMIEDQARYFRDKEGNQYNELADFVRLNVWQFNSYRQADLEYRMVMGNEKELPNSITKSFYNSVFTKPAFNNMSALANVLTMAGKYDSKPVTVEELKAGTRAEPEELDTVVGGAINTAFQAYYNISDANKLRELLGDDTPLLDIKAIRQTIKERAAAVRGNGTTAEDISDEEASRFIESNSGDPNNSASKFFTEKESVTTSDIIAFINIYNIPTKQTEIITIVDNLIMKAIQHKYQDTNDPENSPLNNINAKFAQLQASLMARLYGAGWRNDLTANANDAGSKPGKLREYRLKQAQGSRGGVVGNPYSVFMLKQVMVDYLTAARTETLVKNEDGSVFVDDYGKTHYYSILELMEQMEKAGKDSRKVMMLAKELRPVKDSMRDYAQNHMQRAFEIYSDITGSTEIDWHKFTEEDNWGNVRINRAAFESEFKDNFLKKIRYCYSTYAQFDFSKEVRAYVPNKDPKKPGSWENQPLALALFGKEILDVEPFWKKDKDGTVHEHVIDFQLVNANKEYLWKQVALGRLAADIYAHRDYFSTDKRYNMLYYRSLVEAIESVQADLIGDENDMQGVKRVGRFFDEEQMEWLKDKAYISSSVLYREQIIRDIFGGSVDGLMEALKLIFKGITK
jgi:hypothetical protein